MSKNQLSKQQQLLDIIKYVNEDNVESLSKIPNIINILKIIQKKNPSFNSKINSVIPNIKTQQQINNIQNIEFTKEDEDSLNKLIEGSEEGSEVDLDDIHLDEIVPESEQVVVPNSEQVTVPESEQVAVPESNKVDLDEIVPQEFLTLLQSMIDKLPPLLKDPIEQINPAIDEIKNKEFCYKFLYSMKNGPVTNKNPTTNKIYNNIIDYYGIKDLTKEEVFEEGNISSKKIHFEDGLVVVSIPTKGGTTQKRRKKPKSHTIKTR